MEGEKEELAEQKKNLADDLASAQEASTKLKAEAEALTAQQEELQKELQELQQAYARAMEVINTPLELGTKDELKRRIREGMILKDQLVKANKTLEEYKEKYVDVVPSSILEERNALEEELEQANIALAEREEELAKWELLSKGVRVIRSRTFNAGQPYGTLYNIFVYEYSKFLMTDAPPDIWS